MLIKTTATLGIHPQVKNENVLIKKEYADDFDSYLKDLLMSLIR